VYSDNSTLFYSSFVCDVCDMGDSGSDDDNTPYDVCAYNLTTTLRYSYDDDASVTCTENGCK
jgi:hypothetical protein